jgi:hypothetical protein
VTTSETTQPATGRALNTGSPATTLLGFFVGGHRDRRTPRLRTDLGDGIAGLRRVADSYILIFAAFLLAAGSLTDRIGAKRAMGGAVVFSAEPVLGGVLTLATCLALVAFVATRGRATHSMVPLDLSARGGRRCGHRVRVHGRLLRDALRHESGPVVATGLLLMTFGLVALAFIRVSAWPGTPSSHP